MRKLFIGSCISILMAIALTGCGYVGLAAPEKFDDIDPVVDKTVIEESVVESSTIDNEELIETVDEIEEPEEAVGNELIPEMDYAQIRPDESGEIMIVMYHNLSETNTTYSRTIESFKSDLQRLFDMGFTTISMKDYIDGNINVEAGRTPVVLTFDDGHRSNFNYLETDDGLVIDPDCVIGIMNAFYEKNPSFGRSAVFYLNAGNPFGQPKFIKQKLEYLFDNGYEIGNHAYNHEDLTDLDAEGIQKALGKNTLHFNNLNQNLVMESLALPYGKSPQSESFKSYVIKGQYEGFEYHNRVVLRVGWKPYYPVYHENFNGSGVHRVQSGDADMQLSWWLDEYEKNPHRRFISDGLESRISVPSINRIKINMDAITGKELFEYTLED